MFACRIFLNKTGSPLSTQESTNKKNVVNFLRNIKEREISLKEEGVSAPPFTFFSLFRAIVKKK